MDTPPEFDATPSRKILVICAVSAAATALISAGLYALGYSFLAGMFCGVSGLALAYMLHNGPFGVKSGVDKRPHAIQETERALWPMLMFVMWLASALNAFEDIRKGEFFSGGAFLGVALTYPAHAIWQIRLRHLARKQLANQEKPSTISGAT